MSVSLVLKGGRDAGVRFEFTGKPCIKVGASPMADVVISDDLLMQPEHFQIEEVDGDEFQLRDLTSQSATKVNSEPVSVAKLNPGDLIFAGLSVFQFVLDDNIPTAGTRFVTTPFVTTPQEESAAAPPEAVPAGQPYADVKLGDAAEDTVVRSKSSDESMSERSLPDLEEHAIEVLGEIGRGSFGRVLKARRLSDDETVAIKLLEGLPAESPERVKFLLREIQVHEKLDHPNIVRFFGSGAVRGRFAWFVMEYVKGVTLRHFVQVRRKPMPVPLACSIVRQVLSALDFAHRFPPPDGPFVHRDVKPSNILIFSSGNGGYDVKLCDFGLAKNFERAGLSRMTATGQSRGNLGYMSPEQVADSKYVGPEVDVYAMGGVLYFCLTGKLMYDVGAEPSAIEILQAKQEGRIVPLSERRDDVPEVLQTIVDRAVGRDEIRRFRTAGQMARALDQATEDFARLE